MIRKLFATVCVCVCVWLKRKGKRKRVNVIRQDERVRRLVAMRVKMEGGEGNECKNIRYEEIYYS